MSSEYEMHKAVVRYLCAAYPSTRFHSDLSGVKLNRGTVAKMRALNGHRGFPDLVIYEKRGHCCGLALELKREGTKVFKKDGTLRKDTHLEEQKKWLDHLSATGFQAEFVVGFDEAREVIDAYMRKNGAQWRPWNDECAKCGAQSDVYTCADPGFAYDGDPARCADFACGELGMVFVEGDEAHISWEWDTEVPPEPEGGAK
ncbi:MAG: hypothetical protein AAF570_02010 [Bacteroidota bacterium]